MFEHEYLESIPLYALDALSGMEKTQIDQHLKLGCDICEPELRVFRETCNRLPHALPNALLPSEIKEKIWDRIQSDAGSSRLSTRRMLLAAAVTAFVVLTGLWFVRLNTRLEKESLLVREMRQLLLEQKKEIEWLRDPAVQLALLTGMGPVPQAKGKMVWNPLESRGLFYVNALPPLSVEKSYQLWVIGNQGPVSAGIFSPDPQGTAVITITRIEGSAEGTLQFAVTIEPRGGVPQPTGDMVLSGKAL